MAILRLCMAMADNSGTGELAITWYEQSEESSVALAIASASDSIARGLTATAALGVPPASGTGNTPITTAAVLRYLTSNGNLVSIVIPGATNPALYMADGETVNPGAALINAISTQFIAHGISAAGETISSYSSGTKVVMRRPGISH